MKKLIIMAALFFSASTAYAGTHAQKNTGMEECVPMKDGKNLIKEGKADGRNSKGEEVVHVPVGECAKINNGDFSSLSHELKEKLNIA